MDFIKYAFKNRKSYLVAIILGISMFVGLKRANLFIENQEIGYYIAVVLAIVACMGFTIGMVYLLITDYIRYRHTEDKN